MITIHNNDMIYSSIPTTYSVQQRWICMSISSHQSRTESAWAHLGSNAIDPWSAIRSNSNSPGSVKTAFGSLKKHLPCCVCHIFGFFPFKVRGWAGNWERMEMVGNGTFYGRFVQYVEETWCWWNKQTEPTKLDSCHPQICWCLCLSVLFDSNKYFGLDSGPHEKYHEAWNSSWSFFSRSVFFECSRWINKRATRCKVAVNLQKHMYKTAWEQKGNNNNNNNDINININNNNSNNNNNNDININININNNNNNSSSNNSSSNNSNHNAFSRFMPGCVMGSKVRLPIFWNLPKVRFQE